MASTSSYEESHRNLRSGSDDLPEGSLSGEQASMPVEERMPEIGMRDDKTLPPISDLAEQVSKPLIEALEDVPVEQVGGKKKMQQVMAILKNKKYMAIIVAVLLLVVALGGGGYMYKKRKASSLAGPSSLSGDVGLLGSIKNKVMSTIGRGGD